MSEVHAKAMQQTFWDILGKPEKKQFMFAPVLGGKRILGKQGSYWYQGNDNDGDKSKEEPEDEQEDDSGGSSSSGDNDPRHDPSVCPEVGDSIVGLKDMTDCGTGRCVNVNFTMPPRPPEGWEGACSPPNTNSFDVVYRLAVTTIKDEVLSQKVTYYLNSAAMFAAADKEAKKAKSFTYKNNYNNNVEYKPPSPPAELTERYSYYYSYATDYSKERRSMNSVLIQGWVYSCQQYPRYCLEAKSQLKKSWPPETCAEMESTTTGFKPACEEHDPNIPLQLKGDNTAIQLCDKNGNPVTITRYGKGWKVETNACTATVSENGTVTTVQKNNP